MTKYTHEDLMNMDAFDMIDAIAAMSEEDRQAILDTISAEKRKEITESYFNSAFGKIKII